MFKRSNLVWTTEEDAKLIELAKAGVSLRSAAVRFGRSEHSIKKRATIVGITFNRIPRFRSDSQPPRGRPW